VQTLLGQAGEINQAKERKVKELQDTIFHLQRELSSMKTSRVCTMRGKDAERLVYEFCFKHSGSLDVINISSEGVKGDILVKCANGFAVKRSFRI
jgi:hypothetical protein